MSDGLQKERSVLRGLLTGLPIAALLSLTLAAGVAGAGDKPARVIPVYEHDLPGVPGKVVRGVLVEYEPGGKSPGHRHAPSAFIYATVLEGAVRSAVNDGPVRVYHAGENFTELPGDIHRISENASDTEPARLLAVFVVDADETRLTTPLDQ
ncbi:MAG: cupin domain-containing protein [Alphaproteobacteria bacterium]|nr:cupin domain-containing protein [Alphaproteobacteria bacterium]